MILTIPNLLSLFRIGSVPVLIALAVLGKPSFFLALFILALVSDALDGFFARKFGTTSALGGKLDTWGDIAVYLALPFCVWRLWPQIMARELISIIIACSSLCLPLLLGFLKFGKLTSYHTRGAKIAGLLLGISTPLLLMGGPSWPFRLAVAFFVVAEIEECLITFTLPAYETEIPSLRHLLNRPDRHGRTEK